MGVSQTKTFSRQKDAKAFSEGGRRRRVEVFSSDDLFSHQMSKMEVGEDALRLSGLPSFAPSDDLFSRDDEAH